MKILILSWYFPPANDVAALRVGKMAEYLRDAGHDIWVLTGDRQHLDQSLSSSLCEERIIRTRWFDVNHLHFSSAGTGTAAVRVAEKQSNIGAADVAGSHRPRRRFSSVLARAYMDMVQIPDRQIGWLPYLMGSGKKLLAAKKFDLLYASGPPFTPFVAARSLSRRFRVPWVAEYRDGWSRYVYAPRPQWRQAIDELIENRVTPTASGIVTVSEPWTSYYRGRFQLPTLTVYNGFDPDSFSNTNPPPAPGPDQPLSIVHMGALYAGMRDPSVLYAAIQRSGLTPKELRIVFYGPQISEVYPLAAQFGVTAFLAVKDRVPYRKSLEIQRASDVLLLLQSPRDSRNVPAKIFEYLAARRPTLGLGLDDGIPAQLVRNRNAGFYVTESDALAAQLKHWVVQKKELGLIPDLPASVFEGLSRADQFSRLEEFLSSIVARGERSAG